MEKLVLHQILIWKLCCACTSVNSWTFVIFARCTSILIVRSSQKGFWYGFIQIFILMVLRNYEYRFIPVGNNKKNAFWRKIGLRTVPCWSLPPNPDSLKEKSIIKKTITLCWLIFQAHIALKRQISKYSLTSLMKASSKRFAIAKHVSSENKFNFDPRFKFLIVPEFQMLLLNLFYLDDQTHNCLYLHGWLLT